MTREGTKSGVLLGTVPYMSPEQARRKSIDQRTDIWAFGCVLFETVTAKNCFLGETITDTLAAVVRAEPDWTALPAMVPAKLRDLLMRCVKKDPRQRLQHVGDARIAIDEALEESAGPVPVNEARDVRGAILYLVAGVSAILGAGLTWLLLSSTTTPSGAVTRSVLSLAPSDELAMRPTPSIAISPDGRSVVYVGRSGDTTGLYLRRLEELEAKPIEGTAGGEAPFFSPDGQWVGFQSGGTLTKVSLSGGAPVSIARLGSARAVARAGVAMAPLFSPMDLVQGYRGSQRTAALSVRRVRAYRDLHSALFGRRRQVNVLAVPDLENDDDELGLRGTVENPIASHPSYAGMFRQDPSFPAGPDVYRALGGTMFGFGRRPPEPIVPRTAKVIHTGLDAAEIGRTYPVDLGVVAGVKATVSAVLEEVRRRDLPGVVGKDIGCNLSSPEIDHVSLAKGYGVDGERVREPGELGPALGRYLAAMSEGRPYVLDAAVARRFGGAESTWYDFFSVAKREARRS